MGASSTAILQFQAGCDLPEHFPGRPIMNFGHRRGRNRAEKRARKADFPVGSFFCHFSNIDLCFLQRAEPVDFPLKYRVLACIKDSSPRAGRE